MLAALSGGLGSLLRTLAPTAINWGLNKLSGTRAGRVAHAALPIIQQFVPSLFTPEPPKVTPLLNMTE